MSGVLSRMLSSRTAASRWVSFAGTVNNNAASVAILDGPDLRRSRQQRFSLSHHSVFAMGQLDSKLFGGLIRGSGYQRWSKTNSVSAGGLASNQHRHSGSDVARRVVGIPEINRSI